LAITAILAISSGGPSAATAFASQIWKEIIMRAVVFRGVGDIRLERVPDPKIQKSTDAIVRLTASAICGTDLHMVRGTMPGMVPGTVLGHEGVGVVEEVGNGVRNF
jgi:threonine dehydrogenase-like Zn-dependent dehydrogenase